MPFPLISEYIEAIKSAEDNFEELTNLRPVLDDEGQPVMTSGNFAVVFKMKDIEKDKFYALKCFTKEQEGREEAYHQIAEELESVESPYLISIQYLDKELFVDTDQTTETEFPVLLMDWVEGKTLDKYLRENLDDKYVLEMLAYRFSLLAQWLIPQSFAHGDLKPDNILVRDDGTLVLVDYDGMYVPAMKGQKARELGSPDFRHPQRTEDDFDEHNDDFSIVSILLSLKVISSDSFLLKNRGFSDKLLLSKNDYCNISNCNLLKEIFPSDDMVMNKLISLFIIVLNDTHLQSTLYRFLIIEPSELQQTNIALTSIKEQEWKCNWVDNNGATYSEDRTKLIWGPYTNSIYHTDKGVKTLNYSIQEGTKVISDRAFEGSVTLGSVLIPESVTHIGERAFNCLEYLRKIIIPHSVKYIGNNPFRGCDNLRKMICLSNHFIIQDGILYSIDNNNLICCINRGEVITIPETISSIGDFAFSGCIAKKIAISDSVTSIGDFAFEHCNMLESITIPENVSTFGEGLFFGCEKLVRIVIKNRHANIGNITLVGCESIKEITVPIGSKEYYSTLMPDYESIIVDRI